MSPQLSFFACSLLLGFLCSPFFKCKFDNHSPDVDVSLYVHTGWITMEQEVAFSTSREDLADLHVYFA